ncbi:MAG: DoxX family protein [Kiloniellales bacterium]|nr:DoxX family protein [Kiloniellales bacterium]
MTTPDSRTQGAPRPIIPAVAPLTRALAPYGYPLIRFAAGLFVVPHGAQKLFGWFGGDINATAAFFGQIGLAPALPLAYLTGVVEVFGGLFLALGLLTRPAAAAIAVLMAVAAFKVHLANGFFWTNGGYEYPLLWGIIALACAFHGGGWLSLDRAIGREF